MIPPSLIYSVIHNLPPDKRRAALYDLLSSYFTPDELNEVKQVLAQVEAERAIRTLPEVRLKVTR